MRLRSKIHLYSSALFAVLLVVMNILVYVVFSKLTLTSQLDRVEVETVKITAGIRQSAKTIATADLFRAYVPVNGMIRMVTPGQTDRFLVTSSSEKSLNELAVTYYADKQTQLMQHDGRRYAFVSIPVIWSTGEVVNIQITESLQDAVEHLQVLRLVLVAMTAIALFPVSVSGLVLSRLIMHPIAMMTQTMKAIQRSSNFMRLKLNKHSKDELVEMGETFNEMIGLLESNFKKQEEFVSNASHELRTPLTVIESYASLLRRRGHERPELFDESVEAIHSEAVRMQGLTEQLLLLARRNEQWNLTLGRVELSQVARHSAKTFERAYNREIQVQTSQTEQDIYGYTDADKLRQIMFILLDNAQKYSVELISIVVGIKDGESYIEILDRGIGIPKQELPKVFDRFYRADKSRSRQAQTGGFGLGLSLAKEMADAIGARIVIDSLEGVGTTVALYMKPSAPPKS